MADGLPAGLASVPRGRVVRNPLSLVRVTTAIARTAAGFGVAFMIQSIPAMIDQLPNMNPVWSIVMVGALVASLAVTVIVSAADRWLRAGHVAFAAIYLVALVSWPFAVVDPAEAPSPDSYWLYYTLTIATAMATVGLGIRLATAYVVVVPLIYGVVRLTPPGGGVTITQAVLDSVYAIILGGAITIITAILRGAASSVDRAQATALERYGHAVRQHAIEAERVQVDAIVHDSVLTTLLSAARAESGEAKELAARMAGNAIGHLRDAVSDAPSGDAEISVAALANRIADAAAALSEPVEVDSDGVRPGRVPVAVAEAMYSAAVQAMVNSLQHAGAGVRRWAIVRGGDEDLVVEVGDRGSGFDRDAVPNERLGVRVSILERVASVGGAAAIDTAPGAGTVVSLHWPAVREGSR
ncbi:sensor histidine kinase [Protaetiibacter mangrovi]|uniref:Histidine kinase n=1 Tax=Protaetiibacter mangrovi TaxID=2970926 RepID=A0ABT1ZFK7_9MICO|nr:histidine kinase [Protaetiibacter mangrovi]MCS0499501.1 histidine kinase [Protaetiibacter mangrovi]TPX03019.1 histidine kinase [Schumannella luteola]